MLDATLLPAAVDAERDKPAAVFGRDRELRRLARSLEAARSGSPGVVVVDGAGGMGKTALLEEFTRSLDDVTVVWASGDVDERTVPFGVVDQLLRRSRLSPAIAGDPLQDTTVGLAVLDAVSELQRAGPVVLVIDDAQWADPGSLRALLFAVRRLVADTVLLILAVRTTDLHHLPEGFLRIAAAPQGLRLGLEPLEFDDARAIARDRGLALSTHAVQRVHELSAGVPLHLRALLDEWAVTGDFETITAPPSYAALIAGRVAQCGEEARRLVEAAAVLGQRSSIDMVARIAEVGTPLAGLDEAVERNLIRTAKRTIEFVHPLTRSAVRDALGPARLAQLHAAAAAVVDDPGAALLHRARAAAGADDRLAGELEAAAHPAAAGGNWLRAAEFLQEAAALSTARAERERRTLDSVSALCEAGDLVVARSTVPRIRDFAMTAAREFVLGKVAHSQLDLRIAEQHFHAAWRLCPAANRAFRVSIAGELASCAYFRLDAQGQMEWAQRAMDCISTADSASIPAVTKHAIALAMTGSLQDGLGRLDRLLDTTFAEGVNLEHPKTVRGRLRIVDGDLAGARADLTDVTSAAQRGSSRSAGLALGRLSLAEYYAGRWDLALTHAGKGLAACMDRVDYAQITVVRAPAVLVLAARGAWQDADQHLQAMLVESGDVKLPSVYAAFAGAHLAAAKGDPAGVYSALAPVLALESRDAVDEPGFWQWQDRYAEALVDLGRLDEAEHFLAFHEARARDRGRRSSIAALARARAKLEAARGRDAVAQDAFVESARLLSRLSMPYELALTELAHGQFLRRRRQRRAAVEVLANARERLAAVGAHPALEQCERELRASGLSPKRPAAKGPGRLTPQEITVSRLVLEGMTNREIAGELMVSSKTVEVHLTSVYAKLEVKSRAELRARARRGDLELSSTG